MHFAAQREPCPCRYRRDSKISAAAFRHDDALGSVVQHGRRTFHDLETAVFQFFQLRRSPVRRIIDGRAPGQGRQQDLLAGHYLCRRRRRSGRNRSRRIRRVLIRDIVDKCTDLAVQHAVPHRHYTYCKCLAVRAFHNDSCARIIRRIRHSCAVADRIIQLRSLRRAGERKRGSHIDLRPFQIFAAGQIIGGQGRFRRGNLLLRIDIIYISRHRSRFHIFHQIYRIDIDKLRI